MGGRDRGRGRDGVSEWVGGRDSECVGGWVGEIE